MRPHNENKALVASAQILKKNANKVNCIHLTKKKRMLFSTQHYVRNNIKEYDEHTHSTLKNDGNDALTYTRTAR